MPDFSIADHLDDRTTAQLLELARHATIGEPVNNPDGQDNSTRP